MSKTFKNIILATTKLLAFNIFYKNPLIYIRDVECSTQEHINRIGYTNDEKVGVGVDENITIMNEADNLWLLNHLWKCASCNGGKKSNRILIFKGNIAFCDSCYEIPYNESTKEDIPLSFWKECVIIYFVKYNDNEKTILLRSYDYLSEFTLMNIFYLTVEKLNYRKNKKIILPEYTLSSYSTSSFDKTYLVKLADYKEWKTCYEILKNGAAESIKDDEKKNIRSDRKYPIEDLECEKITSIERNCASCYMNTMIQLFKIIFDIYFYDNLKREDEIQIEQEDEKLQMFLDIIHVMHLNNKNVELSNFVKCMTSWAEKKRSDIHESLVFPEESSSRKVLSNKNSKRLETPLALPNSYGRYDTVESFAMDLLDILQSSKLLGDFIRKKLFVKFEIKNELKKVEIFYISIIDLDFTLTKVDKEDIKELKRGLTFKIKAKLDSKLQKIFSDEISKSIEMFLKNFGNISNEENNISWDFADYLLLRPIFGHGIIRYVLPERIELLDINKKKIIFEKEGSGLLYIPIINSEHYFFRRKGIWISDEKVRLVPRNEPEEKEALVLYKRVNN